MEVAANIQEKEYLYLIKVDNGVHTYHLSWVGPSVLIGNGDGCDLSLKDTKLGKLSVEFSNQGSVLTFFTLESESEFKLNQRSVEKEAEVCFNRGDEVQIGHIRLQIQAFDLEKLSSGFGDKKEKKIEKGKEEENESSKQLIVVSAGSHLDLIKERYAVNEKRIYEEKTKNKNIVVFVALSTIVFVSFFIYGRGTEQVGVTKTASEIYLDKIIKKRVETKIIFQTQKNSTFKETYVDNVLHTKGYLEFRTDDDHLAVYTVELSDFFLREFDFKDNQVVEFLTVENKLIRELEEVSSNMSSYSFKSKKSEMRIIEDARVETLIELIGSKSNFQKYHKFQEKFFKNLK